MGTAPVAAACRRVRDAARRKDLERCSASRVRAARTCLLRVRVSPLRRGVLVANGDDGVCPAWLAWVVTVVFRAALVPVLVLYWALEDDMLGREATGISGEVLRSGVVRAIERSYIDGSCVCVCVRVYLVELCAKND